MGDFIVKNCRWLEAVYNYCAKWANQYNAAFAFEKYQLIHFTRQRRHATTDLMSTVCIASCKTAPEKTSM